jgi:Leucine-rich repeat (LRR) protein
MAEFDQEHKIVLKCLPDQKQFPIEVLNIWHVTELEIIGGDFTYFPEDISILRNLRKLTLVSTKVSKLPREIFELPHLEYLSLKNNRISELPDLYNKSTIKELILGRNYLTTNQVQGFFQFFPELHYLDLGNNFLDEVPEGIISATYLNRLNLEGNKLKTLPLKLKELKNLVHLSVGNNPFPESERDAIEKIFNISL